MEATLLFHEKGIDELGNIIEGKIWELPEATKDKPHGYKYSLVYIVEDVRVIGYDNAEGKGDHRHIHEKEEAYTFVSLKQLAEDFFNDIENYKRGEI